MRLVEPIADCREGTTMALKVKRITLWRKELENKTGTLAGTLEPLAKTGADLQLVMGYRYPGESTKAAVELYPIGSKKATRPHSLPGC